MCVCVCACACACACARARVISRSRKKNTSLSVYIVGTRVISRSRKKNTSLSVYIVGTSVSSCILIITDVISRSAASHGCPQKEEYILVCVHCGDKCILMHTYHHRPSMDLYTQVYSSFWGHPWGGPRTLIRQYWHDIFNLMLF